MGGGRRKIERKMEKEEEEEEEEREGLLIAGKGMYPKRASGRVSPRSVWGPCLAHNEDLPKSSAREEH